MPYAEGRLYHDADSHVMETAAWLVPYADAPVRELLKPIDFGLVGNLADHAQRSRRDTDYWTSINIEANLMKLKGWEALGAFDRSERSHALDLLGFSKQLVFSTIALSQFWGFFSQREYDVTLLYGGARAYNRAIVDFCAADQRLLAVGFVPLDVPELAEREIDEAIQLGCAAIQVAAMPGGDKSPTHPVFNGVWARLQDADTPFTLHIGAGPIPVPSAYANNGRGPTEAFVGGGEALKSRDAMFAHVAAEMFLTALVLDGTLEQFPRLRGGIIELGALWVVPWLKRLDAMQQAFMNSEPALALPLKASDYVRRQLHFTPYPTEPVGWIIEQTGEDLFMFSSDYPHVEGGRDPLKRFESAMSNLSDAAKARFYAGNFADLMGW